MAKFITSLGLSNLDITPLKSKKIEPGFSGLNLNILHTTDVNSIDDAKENIIESMKREHSVLHNVLRVMAALLNGKRTQFRHEALCDLMRINDVSPQHLNVLAELEQIYKDMNLISKATECKTKIETILQSNKPEDIESKVICLLEQAYVHMMEPTLINENNTLVRLNEANKTLLTELKHSTGQQREVITQTHYHNKLAISCFQETIKYPTHDKNLTRNLTVMEKFVHAEILLGENANVDLPWLYHVAKALNRYYGALSEEKENNDEEMKKATIGAIILFWKVIQDSGEEGIMRAYVARSYAFLGHIYIRRLEIIQQELDNYECLKTETLLHFLNDPTFALDYACSLSPDDKTILNRVGRVFLHKYYHTNPTNEANKLMYLLRAESVLTESINFDHRNWFAFATRMVVRQKLAKEIYSKQVKKQMLLLAKEDGKACFQSKSTTKDMAVLGTICQNLARYHCEDRKDRETYLVEALHYLYHGCHVGVATNVALITRTASCLLDLNEYQEAVEWQWRAWLLSRPEYSSVFHNLTVYMLHLIHFINSAQPLKNKMFIYQLRKFLYLLRRGNEMYGNLSKTYEKLCKYHRDILIIVLKAISELSASLAVADKNILLECLQICKTFVSYYYKCEFGRLEKVIKESASASNKNDNVNLCEIDGDPYMIPNSENIEAFHKGYTFDFFVSHSKHDEAWVHHFLLHQLENSFEDGSVQFKGCVAARDFCPGKEIVENIQFAIKYSFKVILVLSTSFVKSNWCLYETNKVIEKSLKSKTDENCIIPILLEPCDIPDTLNHLIPLDLTCDKQSLSELRRLKNVLL